jgi:hypothetical protein
LVEPGKVVITVALLPRHDIFDLLLLVEHLSVALLDSFFFLLLKLFLVRFLDLSFHLLKFEVLCVL